MDSQFDFANAAAERFEGWVYVLHSWQKKSTQGIKTNQQDVELVKRRLAVAQAKHAAWVREREKGE
jgi:phage-related protein